MQSFSLENAIITAGLTVAGGLIVFTCGQLILKLVIEPLKEYKMVKSKIAISLTFHANTYLNLMTYDDYKNNEKLQNKIDNATEELRKLASEISASVQIIPFYSILSFFKWFPKKEEINRVSSCLIGLSNTLLSHQESLSFNVESNISKKEEIVKILNLNLPD